MNGGQAVAMIVLAAILIWGKAKVNMITVTVAAFFLLLGATPVGGETRRWMGLGAAWVVGLLQGMLQ